MKSEVVSQSTLRCEVPPGPGVDGTGRVTIRVGAPSPVPPRGRQQAVTDVDEFEYRCPVNSQPNSTPAINRSGAGKMVSAMPNLASLLSAAAKSDGSTAVAGVAVSYSQVNAVFLTFYEFAEPRRTVVDFRFRTFLVFS